MGSSLSKNRPALIQFDPRFILLLKILWFIVLIPIKFLRFISRLLYKIAYKNKNKLPLISQDSMDSYLSTKPICSGSSKNLTDSRSFLSYGGIYWVSDLTPQALKQELLLKYPEDEVITIRYNLNNQEKIFDFTVTGHSSSSDAVLLGEVLADIFEFKKIEECDLRSILICQNLGKFLNHQGIPDGKVPGFTIDSNGTVLVSSFITSDQKLCNQLFEIILDEDCFHKTVRAKARNALWNHTISIAERMKNSHFYTVPDSKRKYGSYYGHHIIDSDAKITGGIYLGQPAREAIWIDPLSHNLENIFNILNSKIRQLKEALGPRLEERILEDILKLARETFPRDTENALKQLRHNLRLSPDSEVSLDSFILNETGEADHQALLAGYLLERTQNESSQYIPGNISIDRNWLPGNSHTWIRYTSSNGDVYIIDPKKNYLGMLDNYSCNRWPYERPSDLLKERRPRPIC